MKRVWLFLVIPCMFTCFVGGLSGQDAVDRDLSVPAVPESWAVSDRPEDRLPEQPQSASATNEALKEISESDFVAAGNEDRYPGTLKGKRYHVCEDGFVELVDQQEDRSNWTLGKIHPKVQTKTDALVPVIIELKSKPLGILRQGFESGRKQTIENLQSQIRQLTARSDNGKKMQARAEEKQAVDEEVIGESKKQQIRQLHLQLDGQQDALRKEAFLTANEASRPLREQMRSIIELHRGKVTGGSGLMNCVGAELPGSQLEALAQLDVVESIVPDYPMVLDLDESACAVGASSFWTAGWDGGAYDVAVIDAGVRETHHYLRYKDPIGLLNERPIYKRIAGNIDSHGTRTAGVIASTSSTYQGIAYGLDAIFDSQGHGGNTESYLMDSFDWLFTCTTCGGQSPEVINTSFSLYEHDDEFGILERFYDAVVDDMGVMISKSAGNEGLTELGYPQASNLISVANMDINDTCTTTDDVIRSSSSRGPTDSGRRKPDITAPGIDTYVPSNESDTAFADHGGTSAAAPHVAGALVLLRDAGISNPKAQKAILINTAQTWSDNDTLSTYTDDGTVSGDRWDNTYGWGMMDLSHSYFHRSDYFLDSVVARDDLPDDDDYKLYRGTMYANDKATVVWHRRAVYNDDSEPTTYYSTTDINLRAYNADTGTNFDSDAVHGGNNVHQVSSNAAQDTVIKVYAWSTTIDGATSESYALATEENFAPAEPPLLTLTITMPSVVDYNTNFIVTATISNTGDVPAHGCSVDLTLPAGFTLITGSDPRSVGTIEDGHSSQASWTVRSGAVQNAFIISATVTSSCYAETYSDYGQAAISVGPAFFPDLTKVTRAGWSYPIVPRSTNGATGASCLITATLPGNTTNTNFNWAWTNDGVSAAGSHTTTFYVDDEYFFSSTPSGLNAGADYYHNNITKPSGGTQVKGGRHTLHYMADSGSTVDESDESNNIYSRQFIWSPYTLIDNSPVERTAPPKKDSTGYSYYNNDGFEFYVNNSGVDGYWSTVAILPGGSTADYGLRLWDIGDYTGSEDGFGGGYLEQAHSDSVVDVEFVIVNDHMAAEGTYYAGVINWNQSTDVFRIEEDTSTRIYPRPTADWNGPYSKNSTNVVDMYDIYLTAGEYVFELNRTAGICSLGMSLYDSTTTHAQKSDYMTDAYANRELIGDERFQVNIPAAGYYGLAVWKTNYDDYSRTTTYRIAVGEPSLTLLSPNGGEVIPAGDPMSIAWDNFGDIDHSVRIEISRDNGSTWSRIIVGTPNNGSFIWYATLPGSTQCLIRITNTSTGLSDTSDAVFTIDAAGIPAEMDVSRDGTSIPHKGTCDLGRVNLGYSVNPVFTVTNLGGANLLLNGLPKVQLSGTDTAYFSVVAQPISPVASMDSTTFEIEFTPTALRSYTVIVEIPNSDSNENPYSFKLTGTGSRPRVWYVDDDAVSDPGPDDPSISDPAEDGSLSHPFDMVQEAINAAFHDDTVHVFTGRYYESINLLGKNLHVTGDDPDDSAVVANTILDGFGKGSVVSFVSGETSDCVLEGFTITRGGGTEISFAGITTLAGGGIFCVNSDPVIGKCILRNNQTELGGAVYAEGSDCEMVLEDCMLSKNTASNYHAGAIYLRNSAQMLIQRNQIHTNRAINGSGGAIAVQIGGKALIYDNDIYDNDAETGGGLFIANSSTTEVKHNRIYNNSATDKGGAVKLWGASVLFDYNVFYGNNAVVEGGAVQCAYSTNVQFANSIFWGNTVSVGGVGPNIYLRFTESGTSYASGLTVRYSDVGGGLASCVHEAGTTLTYGPGNFDIDPLFANAAGGDFHVLSHYGRWNPAVETWVIDGSTSACIDAGDPAAGDWTEELWPHGKRVNVGAYGGTPQASKSPSALGNVCDIDNDGAVNLTDLMRVADQWLEASLLIPENTNHSGNVDYGDFNLCSQNWLWVE